MALLGHKKKGQEELAWSTIKKFVAARINLEVGIYRERRTNEILAELWPKFEDALHNGELLDADVKAWLETALANLPALEA